MKRTRISNATTLSSNDLQRALGGTQECCREAATMGTPSNMPRPQDTPKMTDEEFIAYVGTLLEPLPW